MREKKQQRASLAGDAVDADNVRRFASMAPLPESRQATRNFFADAVFDPGLGVTPENSVVNGADTSTDSTVA
jgi:hypothetical protein